MSHSAKMHPTRTASFSRPRLAGSSRCGVSMLSTSPRWARHQSMEDGASKARFPCVDSSCRPCLFGRASWPQAAISVCRCGSVARMPMRHGSKFGQYEHPVHSCVCNGHTMASFSRPFPCTIHACSCGMYRISRFTWSASCVIHAPCIRFTGDVRKCLMIVVHLRSS